MSPDETAKKAANDALAMKGCLGCAMIFVVIMLIGGISSLFSGGVDEEPSSDKSSIVKLKADLNERYPGMITAISQPDPRTISLDTTFASASEALSACTFVMEHAPQAEGIHVYDTDSYPLAGKYLTDAECKPE